MAKKSVVARDVQRRVLVEKYSELRKKLKDEGNYEALQKLPRDSSSTRLRNRCSLTGRGRDPVADYLVRIKNAAQARKGKVLIPFSNLKEAISKILLEKGYIHGYDIQEENSMKTICIKLKYLATGVHAIREMKRVSKPGQRVYKGKGIEKYLSGVGLFIISTSRGIMSDKEARKLGVGGEVLFRVY
ncbi:hypothetical protein CHS0354_023756 [Potamilus streckersoni]|uniref:30S ribosomal protein S8 n=1 Tax=Potamilus streckersoni TaxID=2493646 RepID=A0AAE0RZ67_9BIVA|nr:hypothetical protein CHS0354_023756 [Potamilus streckersoni]